MPCVMGGVEPGLERRFYGQLKPISESFIPQALAVSGFSREECFALDEPAAVMQAFGDWLGSTCKVLQDGDSAVAVFEDDAGVFGQFGVGASLSTG